MTVIARWTITSAYTKHDTGDPDCPNYRVGATVKGPEQREPVEVVPAEQLAGAEAIIRELVRANDSLDGAIGDVRARVGDEAAEQLRGILGGALMTHHETDASQ